MDSAGRVGRRCPGYVCRKLIQPGEVPPIVTRSGRDPTTDLTSSGFCWSDRVSLQLDTTCSVVPVTGRDWFSLSVLQQVTLNIEPISTL